MAEIDPYPISALQDRYGLSSRQAVYDRINKLGIEPASRGKISSDQLDTLDRLDNWIKSGKTVENFISSELNTAINSEFGNSVLLTLKNQDLPTSNIFDDSTTSLIQLVHEIALAIRPQENLLQHLECLERAAAQSWLLSTQEVKQLIGVKPHGPSFSRGSFKFIRSGKIGASSAWRVEKISIIPEEKSVAGIIT